MPLVWGVWSCRGVRHQQPTFQSRDPHSPLSRHPIWVRITVKSRTESVLKCMTWLFGYKDRLIESIRYIPAKQHDHAQEKDATGCNNHQHHHELHHDHQREYHHVDAMYIQTFLGAKLKATDFAWRSLAQSRPQQRACQNRVCPKIPFWVLCHGLCVLQARVVVSFEPRSQTQPTLTSQEDNAEPTTRFSASHRYSEIGWLAEYSY